MRVAQLLVTLSALLLALVCLPPGDPACAEASADAGPMRPAEDSAQEVGRRLFQAIVRDDPELAATTFFPRAAFIQVKAMQKPERYYDKLYARFRDDIHRLHRDTPELAQAEFVELALGHRGGWVAPGEEGNRLPYWAARHTTLRYRVGTHQRALEVRVLITWEQRWYVIHLCEFH